MIYYEKEGVKTRENATGEVSIWHYYFLLSSLDSDFLSFLPGGCCFCSKMDSMSLSNLIFSS